MKYVALPIQKGTEIVGYIRLSRPLDEVRRTVEEFTGILVRSFIIVLVSSILVAFLFSRKLTGPIRDMEQFTERLRKGELPGTLLIRSSDEIGMLAQNINFMVVELQKRIMALQEEKAKVEAAFSSAIDGVLILSRDGRIETVNQGMKTLLGDRSADMVGKTPLEAFRNLTLQKALDHFRTTGDSVSREVELGEEQPLVLDVSITPVKGYAEGEEKAMLVFHDVTRLKQLERMRVDFVANVTHEIKTPLTAILGFVETLQQGAVEDPATAKKFLLTIAKHAERLNRLVDDLLTISNIELGEMRLSFESVSLSGIAENVLNIYQLKAREKRVDVVSDIPEDLPPIRADRDRISQILINILDNAVKYTPEGGKVTVSAAPAPDQAVVVRIADTGIGVPRDEVSRLGERFYRVDKSRSRELGGTGLGLSIVKHLILVHKGRMEIESQLGRGTTVSLYFPIYRENAVR
jgi:two-component system phosphate regulon sensor histidine kinase PhoR